MPLTDNDAAGRLPGVDTLFPGDGEMAALMRARDWSQTPLGPAAEWPQALRAIVRIMLTSRYAIWLGWGPELTFLYNDAYRAMTLGAKHPAVLSRPTREVWAEIWPQIGPRIERVLTTGKATWDEALQLFLERSGYTEETYHTFSYSPIADDLGVIRGNLCIVTEETERVVGERRLALLAELATRLAPMNTTGEVLAATAQALAAGTRDVPFFLLYRFDDECREARLVASSPMPPDHPGLAPVLGSAAEPWPVAELLARGEPVVVETLPGGAWPAGAWERPPERALMILVGQQGQARPAGIFIAGLNPFRRFDEQYQSFLGLLAGQIAAGLSGAWAYEAERRRAESLAELDRAKTVFFSNVSHEFRTPLTLMLGPIEDLRNRTDLPEPVRYPLAVLQRNGLRLLRLVNTLLDFSRIEAGRAEAAYEAVDLAEATADLVSAFRSATERAGLALVVDCPPLGEPVYVDRGMWEKVVLNLVSNAFKYTLEGEIVVRLRRGAPGGRTAQLVVRDTGIGIPEPELPHLFERFRRVEGVRGRTHEGSGIGLALVHELVKLHGGEVAAASDLGRGSTFTVTLRLGSEHLPAARIVRRPGAAPGASGATAAVVEEALRWLPGEAEAAPLLALDDTMTEASPGGGPRGDELILLADDNADMRAYIRRLLAPRWRVEAVANGREALAAIRRRRPDLVIADVMMPELDGFGLLQALRADARTHDLAVLLLSARAGEEARFEGLAAGADDYIVKPFSARELEARVEARLLRSRLRTIEMTELVRARHEAEVANRAKDEFLAMLGHELRNPLAPILTALQLLRLRGIDAAENERRVIERQVKHLVTLVDDLLDVSRLTRGKLLLERRRIELSAVVTQAIETASPLLERNRHQLTVDVPRTGLAVDGDEHRLVQVVANLLANAAKYTDPGGRIFVIGLRQGDEAVLRVRDTGIGISAEMLPKVFDRFVQSPQALDRSHGGLGLGLALARGLLELHQGSVEAHSDGPGAGAELTVRLPLAARDVSGGALGAAAGGAEPATAVTPAARRLRILVVDDNRDAAQMLAEALTIQGHQVRCAYDGPEALAAAQELAPEVAVLDLGLPLMDGFDLARRFAADPVLCHTRLVAVTGYGQEQDRQRTAEAAFAAHLVKPVDLAQLIAAIAALALDAADAASPADTATPAKTAPPADTAILRDVAPPANAAPPSDATGPATTAVRESAMSAS